LQFVGGQVAGASGSGLARADELPRNTNPQAISGDPVEPDWKQRVTITVGPRDADRVGTTDRVIQAAVDYVARKGGGTVRVLPGKYRMRDSVFLQSKVRMLGSGTDSALPKEPSATSRLIVIGDHWHEEVTLADPGEFRVGDGVRLVAKDPSGKGTNIVQRALIASWGNRFKLDRRLEERFHLAGAPRIATKSTRLQYTNVSDVTIENVAVDGNKAHNSSRRAKNAIRQSGRPRTEASYAQARVRRGSGRSNWSSRIRPHRRAGRCQAPRALLRKHGAPARHQGARVGNGRGR
jgi:hypothetical protein